MNYEAKLNAIERKMDGWQSEVVEAVKAAISEMVMPSQEPERERYYVKDIAQLTGLKDETIRKNYINTHKIKAEMPGDSKCWVIEKEEFKRIKANWQAYGRII
ncbi:MAG: hypothetical protein ACKVH8_17660 [Pirellulales bacterium]|jgi:hypothetical protein